MHQAIQFTYVSRTNFLHSSSQVCTSCNSFSLILLQSSIVASELRFLEAFLKLLFIYAQRYVWLLSSFYTFNSRLKYGKSSKYVLYCNIFNCSLLSVRLSSFFWGCAISSFHSQHHIRKHRKTL